MNRALQIGTNSRQLDPRFVHIGHLLVLRWHQGRLDEIIPVLTQIAANNPDSLPVRATLAFAEAVAGDRDYARRLLRTTANAEFSLPRNVRWLSTTCLWAETAAELDEDTAVEVLYQRLLPWRHLFATSGWTPINSSAPTGIPDTIQAGVCAPWPTAATRAADPWCGFRPPRRRRCCP